MRRTMPVPTGVIRPKTLGLKRPATPDHTDSALTFAQLASNQKVRYVVLALFLFALLWFGTRSALSKESAEVADVDHALRDASLDDDAKLADSAADVASANEDAGDDEEEGEAAVKKDSGDDDAAAADDDEGAAGAKRAGGGGGGDDDDELEPKASSGGASSSAGSANKQPDKTLTVQSYFVNFGGLVVDIDKEGSYKYVLMKMTDRDGQSALLVRGCPHKEGTHCYHDDAYKRAKADLEGRGFKAEVLGGGRITRHPARKSKSGKLGYISVFGYSKTFSACADCNKKACVLIKQALPDYGVKWATEGYLESDERKIRDEAWTKC